MGKRPRIIQVNDRMQRGYRYELVARTGRDFDPEFRPELTPKEMLRLGVFGGKYMTDTRNEFPADWFERREARLWQARSRAQLFRRRMPASRFRYGALKAGYIRTIRAAGSNGIVATISVGACRRKIGGRSGAGRRCAATSARSDAAASEATCTAGRASDRRCCTGHMTAARFEQGKAQWIAMSLFRSMVPGLW